MGGTGSGRRPAKDVKVMADGRVVEERVIGNVAGGLAAPVAAGSDTDPLASRLLDATKDDRMGSNAWVRAVFGVEGIDAINVYRVQGNGAEALVGKWTRDHVGGEHDDVDHKLVAVFKAGTFVLKPMANDVWISRRVFKKVVIASASGDQAEAGTLDQAEAALADVLRREQLAHATLQVRTINRDLSEKLDPTRKDEDMKAGDLAEIITALGSIQRRDEGSTAILERLVGRIENLERRVTEARPGFDLGSLATTLLPALTPFLRGVRPSMLAGLVRAFQPPPPPAEPMAPEPTVLERFAPLLEQLMPLVQPLLANAMAARAGAPAGQAPAQPQLPPGREAAVPQFTITDPDTIEVLDYCLGKIDSGMYPDAWGAMKNNPALSGWLQTIEPGVDPEALFFGLRQYDVRFREAARKPAIVAFIRHIQEKVAEFYQSQEAEGE